ncbi:hypothetical protein [Parasitella parasitica]|uniref:Uncharacterized protein n=1 Tax=Parasitella parasitica TaxID=35722 RepID=A0A0B7NUQ1_9FUNG|nr:hypothetical protein [Parasitella parasitica]
MAVVGQINFNTEAHAAQEAGANDWLNYTKILTKSTIMSVEFHAPLGTHHTAFSPHSSDVSVHLNVCSATSTSNRSVDAAVASTTGLNDDETCTNSINIKFKCW